MTIKSPDPSDIGSIFGSSEVAEQYQRGKAQRDKVNAAANEMMLNLADLRPGNRVSMWRPAQGTKRLWLLGALDRRGMFWPRTFLPACSSSHPMRHGRRDS